MWSQKISTVSLLISLLLKFKQSDCLRAQQAPCYEYLCGGEASYLCGSDGITYLNGCTYSQAQCKNSSLYVVSAGLCPQDQNTQGVPPGDTDDGIEVEQVEVSTESSTSSVPNDCADPFCSNEYSPVCGSDGITYANICQFTKAQCRTKGLQLKHEGRCKSHENCLTRICPMREESICASNGKTFRNICELSIAKCYNPNVMPVSNGPCPEGEHSSVGSTCDNPCEDQYRPVCATDAKTYPNICHFENAKCKNNKLKIYKFEPC